MTPTVSPCKVYVGADTREPPGAADCPLVHIFMGAKTAGMDAENLSHTFGIGVEIYDESFVEVEGKDNLVEVARHRAGGTASQAGGNRRGRGDPFRDVSHGFGN